MVDLTRVNVACYNAYFDLWFKVCSQDSNRAWLESANLRFPSHLLCHWIFHFSFSWVYDYNFATTNANYAHRIEAIESELVNLDSRLDTSEAFRIQLASDLAEIKTDLLWIRRSMEEQGK